MVVRNIGHFFFSLCCALTQARVYSLLPGRGSPRATASMCASSSPSPAPPHAHLSTNKRLFPCWPSRACTASTSASTFHKKWPVGMSLPWRCPCLGDGCTGRTTRSKRAAVIHEFVRWYVSLFFRVMMVRCHVMHGQSCAAMPRLPVISLSTRMPLDVVQCLLALYDMIRTGVSLFGCLLPGTRYIILLILYCCCCTIPYRHQYTALYQYLLLLVPAWPGHCYTQCYCCTWYVRYELVRLQS